MPKYSKAQQELIDANRAAREAIFGPSSGRPTKAQLEVLEHFKTTGSLPEGTQGLVSPEDLTKVHQRLTAATEGGANRPTYKKRSHVVDVKDESGEVVQVTVPGVRSAESEAEGKRILSKTNVIRSLGRRTRRETPRGSQRGAVPHEAIEELRGMGVHVDPDDPSHAGILETLKSSLWKDAPEARKRVIAAHLERFGKVLMAKPARGSAGRGIDPKTGAQPTGGRPGEDAMMEDLLSGYHAGLASEQRRSDIDVFQRAPVRMPTRTGQLVPTVRTIERTRPSAESIRTGTSPNVLGPASQLVFEKDPHLREMKETTAKALGGKKVKKQVLDIPDKATALRLIQGQAADAEQMFKQQAETTNAEEPEQEAEPITTPTPVRARTRAQRRAAREAAASGVATPNRSLYVPGKLVGGGRLYPEDLPTKEAKVWEIPPTEHSVEVEKAIKGKYTEAKTAAAADIEADRPRQEALTAQEARQKAEREQEGWIPIVKEPFRAPGDRFEPRTGPSGNPVTPEWIESARQEHAMRRAKQAALAAVATPRGRIYTPNTREGLPAPAPAPQPPSAMDEATDKVRGQVARMRAAAAMAGGVPNPTDVWNLFEEIRKPRTSPIQVRPTLREGETREPDGGTSKAYPTGSGFVKLQSAPITIDIAPGEGYPASRFEPVPSEGTPPSTSNGSGSRNAHFGMGTSR